MKRQTVWRPSLSNNCWRSSLDGGNVYIYSSTLDISNYWYPKENFLGAENLLWDISSFEMSRVDCLLKYNTCVRSDVRANGVGRPWGLGVWALLEWFGFGGGDGRTPGIICPSPPKLLRQTCLNMHGQRCQFRCKYYSLRERAHKFIFQLQHVTCFINFCVFNFCCRF